MIHFKPHECIIIFIFPCCPTISVLDQYISTIFLLHFSDTKRREPWLFGETNTLLIRAAIRARYAILPYLYTAFYLAAQTGAPVMR